MSTSSVSVRLGGKEYRIRSDADPAWLQQVASHVDDTMQKIRDRTGTIDTLDLALLASLNLARELISLRRSTSLDGGGGGERLRTLIELAESAVDESHALGAHVS